MSNRSWRIAAPLAVLLGAAALATSAAASSPAPFQDPNVAGFVGLCDNGGHPVTQGDLATTPFAASAVSSRGAQAPYNGTGRTATLYAYQPRQNVPPDQWSGEQLSAASRYTDAAHPMAVTTGGDASLQDFVADYPATWDGLVQLRLYLSVPGSPPNTVSYSATDLRITGGSWQVVDGGTATCGVGHAVSDESLLLPRSALRSDAQPHATAASSGTAATGSDSHAVQWLASAIVLLAAAGIGAAVVRRRHAAAPKPDDEQDPQPALRAGNERGR